MDQRPLGGGKTQTAHEILRRLPGSVVCDPEHAGFGLRRMLPPALRGDFQDLVSWRQGVVEVLDLALTRHDGVVIVPMTVTDSGYSPRPSAGCANSAMTSGTSPCSPRPRPYAGGCASAA
ncbi:hypothetical protein SFUMM280S_01625 [Streptomyces fumanus]